MSAAKSTTPAWLTVAVLALGLLVIGATVIVGLFMHTEIVTLTTLLGVESAALATVLAFMKGILPSSSASVLPLLLWIGAALFFGQLTTGCGAGAATVAAEAYTESCVVAHWTCANVVDRFCPATVGGPTSGGSAPAPTPPATSSTGGS